MLRDDGEALRNRLDAMERDLARAEQELADLRPKAQKLERAQAGIAEREKEIAELRAKLEPGRRSAFSLAAAVMAVAIAAVTGVVLWYDHELGDAHDVAATREAMAMREAADREAAHASELAALEARLEEAEARARDSEAERATAQHELDRERVLETELRHRHGFVARTLVSRRVRVTGRRDLGSSCTVALTPGDGDCRARVTCGEIEIYPAPGNGGYFSCDVEDGHVVRGADVNPTPVSGDPRLELDGRRGVLTVSDGPNPEWSARIEIGPL